MKKISQREAQRLRKRVKELETEKRIRRNRWRSDYPGGISLRRFSTTDETFAALDTATMLGCTLVGKLDGRALIIYAVREGN